MTLKKISPFDDRRQALRANRVVAIKHRLIQRNAKKSEGSWSLSTTRNMSYNGILFLSDTSYKVGDIVEVSVVISGVIDVVKGNAKVVRFQENGDTSFDVAVKLIQPKTKNRSAKKHSKG